MADGQIGKIGRLLGNKYPWEPDEDTLREWNNARLEYADNWKWFDGTALEELDRTTVGSDGRNPLLYPLKINLIKPAAHVHAYALAGQIKDTGDPVVSTVVEPRYKFSIGDDNMDDPVATKEERKYAYEATEALREVAYENFSRDLELSSFLSSQVLGGAVMKVSWDPVDETRSTGVRWETIDVEDFWCSYDTDYWNYSDAWIRRTISRDTARMYGVNIQSQECEYLEHWDKKTRHVLINGEIAKDPRTGEPLNGKHDFGCVPLIYIPHHRAKGHWGYSLVPDVVGVTKEINLRLADMGDAVRLGVTGTIWGRNMTSNPTEKTLPDGQPWLDLGRALGQSQPPEMGRIAPPTVPQGVDRFTDSLVEFVRIGQFTPSIVYGHEEGSQRSGQTLYNRMWPTLSHVTFERSWWTMAKNRQAEITLRIMAKYGRNGINENHLNRRKRQNWPDMVPPDRQALVTEMVGRVGSGLASRELAIEAFGDAPNIKEEVARIMEWERISSELESKKNDRETPSQNPDKATARSKK